MNVQNSDWDAKPQNLSSGFDQVIPNPAYSATETIARSENLLVANLDMILSNKRITKALIRLCFTRRLICTFVVRKPPDRFSHAEAHIMSSIISWAEIKILDGFKQVLSAK